jgi:serine/threonine protein kinase
VTYFFQLFWCAPEILKNLDSTNPKLFSEQTDVYSFGITVWELFSNGNDPFDVHLGKEAIISSILNGERPPIDLSWPDQVKIILKDCWKADPKRPQFQKIHNDLAFLRTSVIASSNEPLNVATHNFYN